MVGNLVWCAVAVVTPLVAQAHGDAPVRLPPEARARLFGALFLLAIGCVAFVTLTWMALRIGRRNLRRLENSAPPRWSNPHLDDWAQKPLAEKPPARREADEE